MYIKLFTAILISITLRVIFGDYISVGVLDIKQLAEEDTEVLRRTFHVLAFAFKERIHKMGNGKQIVFVVSGVMNSFYYF